MSNRISVVIDVATERANKALGSFRQSVGEADGALGKLKAGTASVGNTMKANLMPMAAAAGVAIAAFAAKSISAASDLEESTNAVNKSFGEAAEGVLKVGENAAESFGLSKSEFNEAAVAFSSFAQTVAGEGGDVAGTIEDMTTRASDFASVMNISVAEASTVFRSGLSGETEPLKRFGIDLSAAAVEAFALANGLVKSKKEMTEAIKVQARYGLLMEKTSKFAGDFADTSDGLANSTRIAQSRITDFQAEVGEQLIPTVASAVNIAMDLADAFEAVGVSASGMGENLNENRGFFGDIANTVENSLNPLRLASQLYNETSGFIDDLGGSSDDASDSADGLTSSMTDAEIAAGRLADANRDAYIAIDRGVSSMTDAERAAGYLASTVDEVTDSFAELRDEITEENALLDAADGFDKVRQAAFDAYTAAADGSVDAEAKARDYERAINDQQLEVLDLIEAIGGVPESTTANILTLLDQGKVDEAERILAELARTRNAKLLVFPSLAGGGFGNIPFTVAAPGRAAGGPVSAGGTYVVGEKGPELLQMGSSSGNVIPNNKLGGGGGSTLNVTINADPNPDVTVRKLREWVRRNGPIQGLT